VTGVAGGSGAYANSAKRQFCGVDLTVNVSLFILLVFIGYLLELVEKLEGIWQVWHVVMLGQIQPSVATQQKSTHEIEQSHSKMGKIRSNFNLFQNF